MAPNTRWSLLQFRLALSLLSLLAAPSLALLPHFPDGDVVDENNLGEGAPQPLSLSDAVHLFQRLQQEEQLNSGATNNTDQENARLIGVTDGGVYRGGECHSRLILYITFTFGCFLLTLSVFLINALTQNNVGVKVSSLYA